MSSKIHDTVPILVWADVDMKMAKLIERLNRIPGVRTYNCCQGTIGEGGAEPYEPYVSVSWWYIEAKLALEKFNLTIEGESFGTIRPNKEQLY